MDNKYDCGCLVMESGYWRRCALHGTAERVRTLVTETHAIIRESWLTEAGRYEQIAALYATDEARALLREVGDGG